MCAKSEALACFLRGHNAQQILSQRGWHAERPSRQETADDEGLGLGRAGERAAVHTSGLTHREKNPQCSGDQRDSTLLGESRLRLVRSVLRGAVQERPADGENMI